MVMKTFFIFNRGGEILFHWSAQEENDKQLSVNAVIKDRLLRKKSEDKLLCYTPISSSLSFNWITHDELGLVFVVSNRKSLSATYIRELLVQVRCA